MHLTPGDDWAHPNTVFSTLEDGQSLSGLQSLAFYDHT